MEHCTKTAESLEDLQILLKGTGLFDTHVQIANARCKKDVTRDLVSHISIRGLRKELQRMVHSESGPTSVIRLI
jgi:hypothetical protein